MIRDYIGEGLEKSENSLNLNLPKKSKCKKKNSTFWRESEWLMFSDYLSMKWLKKSENSLGSIHLKNKNAEIFFLEDYYYSTSTTQRLTKAHYQ